MRSRIPEILLAAFSLAALPAGATIHYTVSVAQPEQHLFRVTMTVPDVKGELVVQLPAWNALYQIRDFAYRVQGMRAFEPAPSGTGRPLPLAKLDKQTWRIVCAEPVAASPRPVGVGDRARPVAAATAAGECRGGIRLEYASYWDDASPFSSQLNRSHAFLNLATILLYVPSRRGEDVRIEFRDVPAEWRIAVALPPGDTSSAFRAASYDALVDAPVEIGPFEEFRVGANLRVRPTDSAGPASPGEASGTPTARLRVVVHGEGGGGWDRNQLEDVVRRIAAYQTGLMRDVPFAEYLFIYHFGPGGGGGMEHANSTAIHLGAGANPAGVSAHEFFHLWNVKRIRPQSLEPVDYTRENWTRALWFAEGVTSTYGAYTLVRTGLWTSRQFYDDLAAQITELESRPARRWKSVEEASLDAWLEKYPYYGQPVASISYYNKGQLLGVLLDIFLRDATNNRASLDDVLRLLNEEFARRGRFYKDSDDIRAAIARVLERAGVFPSSSVGAGPRLPRAEPRGARPEVGTVLGQLDEFFSRYVAGTEELPFADYLARAGLVLKQEERARADFGFAVGRGSAAADPPVVVALEPGSAAAQAGVREGDVLLELDGAPFPRNPGRWLREHPPTAGATVRVRLRRGDSAQSGEREVSFALAQRSDVRYQVEESPAADEKQQRIREGLLRGLP